MSELTYNIIEDYLGEDYPSSFNMEEFKKLNSFKNRISYCESNLKRISSGSSRIVYAIDGTKVLKLAKNAKGLAQNEVEATYANYSDLNSILARVFDYNDDNLWIEMELARKVSKNNFKQIIGYTYEDYVAALNYHYYTDIKPSRTFRPNKPDAYDDMWENEFIYDMFNYIGSYKIPVGDLGRLSSYGLVKREGSESIVLIDYGLTNEVYTGYYS